MNLYDYIGYLEKKSAAAAPAAAPAPPPNPVAGPKLDTGASGGSGVVLAGRRVHTPRVAPSKATGAGPEHAANPLTPSAPAIPGQMVAHNGTLMSAEDAQMQQQAEAEAQAEAEKNQPKPTAPPKQDTVLSKEILNGWHQRLKKTSSSPGFSPARLYPGGGSSHFDPSTDSGMAGPNEFNAFTYNPFEAGSFGNKMYGFAKTMLTSGLRNVKPHSVLEDDLRGPPNAYTQALAANLANPVSVGTEQNPLLALGGNLIASMFGAEAPTAENMGQAVETARQQF